MSRGVVDVTIKQVGLIRGSVVTGSKVKDALELWKRAGVANVYLNGKKVSEEDIIPGLSVGENKHSLTIMAERR